MLSGQPRRRHALENEPDVRSGKTSLARELPCEGEEALGLRRDGSRVVEKQERARTGESPEIGDRGKLVKKLGGILPEHDVDRLSVGDGALALRPDVVGTNHRPLPAEPGDLSTVEICEPKFLAVRGIRENRDTRTPGARPALGVGSPRLDEGPTEGGARAVVRVGASGLEGGAGPDLALPCRLVAVVLEHREAAGGALEHVEPTPEQRVGQWPGGEELLRDRERARPGGPALPPGRGWRKEAVAHAARASKRVTISTATAGRTSSSQAPRSGATPPSVKTQTDRRPARRRCSSGGKPSGPRL